MTVWMRAGNWPSLRSPQVLRARVDAGPGARAASVDAPATRGRGPPLQTPRPGAQGGPRRRPGPGARAARVDAPRGCC